MLKLEGNIAVLANGAGANLATQDVIASLGGKISATVDYPDD